MLHGRAISGNVRAINFRVRQFGQKSDTRRTVNHDTILHRTSVCAVSEPTCSINTGGRTYEKESMEVVGRIVKRERELFGIRVIKRTTHQKCVRCTRKHGTCFTC